VLDVRVGWSQDPVFTDLPVAKLHWQNAGLVFLSKGERGLWPSLRGPLGEFAEEQIIHHLFGILGPLFKPPLEEDKDEEGWIKVTVANPATIVIPAPLIVSAKVERLHGRTYARVTTDDGKVLSFAANDPFMDLSRSPGKGAFFANTPMMMRADHEYFFFFATLLHNVFPEDRQLVLDASKKYFGPNPQDLRQLDTRLAEKGLTSATLTTEARYHLQRFGQFFRDRPDLFSVKLPRDYVPWCFRCGPSPEAFGKVLHQLRIVDVVKDSSGVVPLKVSTGATMRLL